MATVTVDVPEEILHHFDNLDDVRRTMYEDFIIEQRQRGNLSLSRAAELLGISYSEFFDLLATKGLSFINATAGELEASYQRFEAEFYSVLQKSPA